MIAARWHVPRVRTASSFVTILTVGTDILRECGVKLDMSVGLAGDTKALIKERERSAWN